VAADEEAIAEAGTPLKPDLANAQVVKRVRFYGRNQRDCGGASAVGAATVAITLLIGDGKVTLDAFYVLLIVQTLLIYAATFFIFRSEGLIAGLMASDWSGASLAATIGIVSTIITTVASFLIRQLKQHESNVGSLSWWLLLGLAGVGALLGLIIRRSAESLLDELDDESWKQRIAPLVNEQEQAIAEMWKLGTLLRDTPAAAAGSGAIVTSASPGSSTFPPAS
jgi:hypothetical protein